MDLSIAAFLVQDGVTNGAIYALLALALVLVFTVTRIVWIPSGEFVTYGTLTLAGLQLGKPPGTVGLLIGIAVVAALVETVSTLRRRQWRRLPARLALWLGVPLLIALAVWWAAPRALPLPIQVLLTGLGLWFFGPEGSRTPAFTGASLQIGQLTFSAQSLLVVSTSMVLIGVLYLFFGHALYGKALRATAVNRIGARLVGISPSFAGTLTFVLAALSCAFAGVLIGPITTVYYDSGFLVSLKGFVGAIIGGLVSYPLAAVGALLVGLLESFSSFWASAYKEVIVFTLIIPVLLWRSLTTHHHEEDE